MRLLVDRLNTLAVRPRVFKVIPEKLASSPALVRFLQGEQADGSEIVLHGFAHRRQGAWRRPLRRRIRAQLFAPQAAEFFSLSAAEIEDRITLGRNVLQTAGLRVTGFTAPGWIESAQVRATLARLGFGYDVALTHLVDLRTNRRIWTDWVGYMGADTLQESLVGIANRINRRALPMFSVGKVFLHPQGARGNPAVRQVLDQIPELMRGRSLLTYGAIVAEHASSR